MAAGFRYHAERDRQECPVRPVQLRAARLLPLQDGELRVSHRFQEVQRVDLVLVNRCELLAGLVLLATALG